MLDDEPQSYASDLSERLGEAVVQKERAAAQQQLKLKLKEKQ